MALLERLKDRVCVINGAASAIREAVAERFQEEGALVIGVDKAEHSVGDHSLDRRSYR